MTKHHSIIDSQVTISPWVIEKNNNQYLTNHNFFAGVFEFKKIHFFCQMNDQVFVFSIPKGSPYMVMDETYHTHLDKFFDTTPAIQYTPKCLSWKITNSPFVKTVEQGGYFNKSPLESRFQYYIWTENEGFDFISLTPPEVTVFKNTEDFLVYEQIAKLELG